MFEGEIVMLRTFATETGTDVFDDTTIEAQPPGSDQVARRGQVRTHALKCAYSQFRRGEATLEDGLTQHLDGPGKTDAIRVQALALGRLKDQATHGIMRQHQGVEFLQDQLGRAAAQRLLAHALLISGLVDGLFDFPPFVIAQTQASAGACSGESKVVMRRWTCRTCGLVAVLWLCMREGVTCSSCSAILGSMRYSMTRTCRGADKPWQVLGRQGGQIAAIG